MRYETLFTRMLNGFALHEIVRNSSGVPVDYRFLDVNPAFEDLMGVEREQLVGVSARNSSMRLGPVYWTCLRRWRKPERQWYSDIARICCINTLN